MLTASFQAGLFLFFENDTYCCNVGDRLSDGLTAAACLFSDFPRVFRVEEDGSNLKCRFTPLSIGSNTFIGKKCVVESAGIGCNVRIADGCILVRLTTATVLQITRLRSTNILLITYHRLWYYTWTSSAAAFCRQCHFLTYYWRGASDAS